jgi:ATP-binding cassette, subfamily B, bacterial
MRGGVVAPASPAPGIRPGPEGAWRTLVRGLQLSPELRDGLLVTLLLAVVATAGKVAVPVAVQQAIDVGVVGADEPRLDVVVTAVVAAATILVLTTFAGFAMNFRLARASETALSALRVRAFRHIHDLSVLHHAAEHRGALVARVTSDIDQISRFVQWGGVILVVRGGQALLALAAMVVYSWQLTLVVLAVIVPMLVLVKWFQRKLSAAYDRVRESHAKMLTAVSESVVGAATVRAYGIEDRTEQRISEAIDDEFRAQFRAGRLASTMFSSAEVFAGLATAAVVLVGVQLGLAGHLASPGEPWVGRLVAFLFLTTLFVGPLRVATEVLEQAQTAISGWRRVLGVLGTPPDVADPEGEQVPRGPITVRFEDVRFRYPTGPDVLRDVDLEIAAQSRVAIVGETGSGKTTFVKLLTRLMDPTAGRVLLNGVPLDRVRFADLRRRVVMVPQDGFLFDATIAENVRYGHGTLDDDGVRLAFVELGLGDWLEGLPDGVATRVGERGEGLSVGERQLVALARAYVADPDLLVLDEATSAVDPSTEVRIQRALESVTRGRTAVSIAHRLSTAEAADEVLVFDQGRVVQRGAHETLVAEAGVYARLHESWVASTADR